MNDHRCADPRAGALRLDDAGRCFWCGETILEDRGWETNRAGVVLTFCDMSDTPLFIETVNEHAWRLFERKEQERRAHAKWMWEQIG